MIPSVYRCPLRKRLTPCRICTRYGPRVPCTGRWCTANTTASPRKSGTTSARDCMRGRCSVSTNSPPVKSRPGVQRQDQPQARGLDKRYHLCQQRFKRGIPADQVGVRKPVLQVARQGVGFVVQQDGAYAPVALGDQNGAQRTLAKGKRMSCAAPPAR